MNLIKKGITDSKLSEFLKGVKDNPNLKVIHLSHNKIKSLGFSILLDVVAFHPSLESIYLNNNLLDDQIFAMLKNNVNKIKNIKYINLYNNRGLRSIDRYKPYISYLRRFKIKLDFK